MLKSNCGSLQNPQIKRISRSLHCPSSPSVLLPQPLILSKNAEPRPTNSQQASSHGRPRNELPAEHAAAATARSVLGEELAAVRGARGAPGADGGGGGQGVQCADSGGRERGGGVYLPQVSAGGDARRRAAGDQASPEVREQDGREEAQGARGRTPQPSQAYDGRAEVPRRRRRRDLQGSGRGQRQLGGRRHPVKQKERSPQFNFTASR